MPVLVTTQALVQWTWGWPGMKQTIHVHLPDSTEHTELDSCLKSGFYTLIVEFS